MFNRRHYDFVASVIVSQRNHEPIKNKTLDELAWAFADKFAEDNSAFNPDRFFNATVDGVVRRPRAAKLENAEVEATGVNAKLA